MADAKECTCCGSWGLLVNGLCSSCIDDGKAKQLVHAPKYLGGPCERCGLVYCADTSYVPCFVEGDSRATWLARHWDSLFPDVEVETLEQHIVLRVSGQEVADAEIDRAQRLGLALLEVAKVNYDHEFLAIKAGLAAFVGLTLERVGSASTRDIVEGILQTALQLRETAASAKVVGQ